MIKKLCKTYQFKKGKIELISITNNGGFKNRYMWRLEIYAYNGYTMFRTYNRSIFTLNILEAYKAYKYKLEEIQQQLFLYGYSPLLNINVKGDEK